MKYTNKLNLPEVFTKFTDTKPLMINRYSVTELLGPVQEIKLKRRYWNEIEVDVADCVPMLFGSAVHKILEQNSNPEQSEVKYEVEINGSCVVGIADNVCGDTISDYKTATTSKKDFTDYENQVFAYAWLRLLVTGQITRHGKIYVLFKDWSKIKAASSSNYPQSPILVHEFNIEDSDYEFIEKYIKDKITRIHVNSEWDLCSDEDRWYTGTKYAVYKKAGDKKAAYVADSEEDAHNYITNKCDGAGEIEVRKGEYIKCKYYCSVSKFCNQCKEVK